MTLAEVGRTWREAGVSVIPIAPNFSKRPPLPWKPYQGRIASLDEVSEWWGNGRAYGLALICGAVSGNLELTEIEGRAMKAGAPARIFMACDELDCAEVFDRLLSGYTQESPSGGLHLLYRVSDHPVPGNTKLAVRADGDVLAETRGEGGYVVGAPSPGTCHPSGVGWKLTSGEFGSLPTITWAERNLLHQAIAQALDESPPPPPPPPVPPAPTPRPQLPGGLVRPGDDFADQVDWADILEPAGWQLESHRGEERMWTRPGKSTRDGASATTNYQGKPGLYVFSTSAGLPTENPLSKLFVYAHYNHGGDLSRAAAALRDQGFGSSRPIATLDEMEFPAEVAEDRSYTLDETGNSQRLWDRVRGKYFWHAEEKRVYRWTDTVWERDLRETLPGQMIRVTDDMMREAADSGNESLGKWAKASRSHAKITASVNLVKYIDGAVRAQSELDPDRHLLNVDNGVLNLETMELVAHHPEFMMTRIARAAYNPQAICPTFERFMEQILPQESMRSYVQRALGYTLLGDSDQRALFLAYGPSGTGKSTLMEIMRLVLGGYASVASAGTFKSTREKAPSNDLHRLRGKRFVTSSETAESASFDEDLLKRITGRDEISSRELYQEFQEWTPECVLWLATNHPPRFSSDDDALWRRVKMIPFTTQFTDDEIPDMARRHLLPEADGILMWLLRGLREYQQHGLQEPAEVRDAVQEQRLQSDNVARFLDDQVADSILVEDETATMPTRDLLVMYQEWCRRSGERSYGSRRFILHVEQTGRATYDRSQGRSTWVGLRPAAGTSALGTWGIRPG